MKALAASVAKLTTRTDITETMADAARRAIVASRYDDLVKDENSAYLATQTAAIRGDYFGNV
jgi:hypothetical protein